MGNVNIRPDQASEGGGLIDDFDGTITDMRFIMTDYGKPMDEVPVCRVVYDVGGEEHDDLLSVGGDGDFQPDESGRGIDKLKTKNTLTKQCQFIMYSNSLVESGFPLNRMDLNDVTSIIGTKGHFLRTVVKRKGSSFKKKEDDRPETVLLCTKVLELPGEAKAGKGKTKAKRTTKAAVKAADPELADTVAAIIQELLVDNEGTMSKTAVLGALFKSAAMSELDDKNAGLKVMKDDTFLHSREEWTYKDGVLSMA